MTLVRVDLEVERVDELGVGETNALLRRFGRDGCTVRESRRADRHTGAVRFVECGLASIEQNSSCIVVLRRRVLIVMFSQRIVQDLRN